RAVPVERDRRRAGGPWPGGGMGHTRRRRVNSWLRFLVARGHRFMVNVTFWGVRGSTPCPCDQNMRYGGNTACVSVEAPGLDPVVFDLGTGLRFFGEAVAGSDAPFRGIALVTHMHWDHVQGL